MSEKAVTLKELAELTGYSYSVVRRWPIRHLLLSGRIFPSDFELWRRSNSGLLSVSDNGKRPPNLSADKSDALLSRHDS